jgi:competence protein ComEA
MRPAITLTALAVFLATAVLTLAAPATAEVNRTEEPSALSKKSRTGRADRDAPRTVRSDGKVLVGVLNLNSATAEQLEMLPGIGPTKAERVVDYRTRRGRFRRVRDLRRVKGFGFKTVRKIAIHLTVEGPNTLKIQSLGE